MGRRPFHKATSCQSSQGSCTDIYWVREGVVASHNYTDEVYHFSSITDPLDTIVKATAQATNRILAAAEKSIEPVGQIREKPSVDEVNELPDKITENSTKVL